MLKKVIMVIMVVVVLGAALPILIPMATDTTTDIAAIQGIPGDDPAVDLLVELWPIMLLIIILGIAAGVIFYGLKHFGVIG